MIEKIDQYLRRSDTPIARLVQHISPQDIKGPAYFDRPHKRHLDLVITIPTAPFVAVGVAVLSTVKFFEDYRNPFYHGTFTRLHPGKRFWKIRSLRTGADKVENPVPFADGKKSQDDTRATRFGRFLRRTHSDELPQMFAVMRGDMSIVGNRPVQDTFISHLERVWPPKRLYRWETSTKQTPAGLTGTYQIFRDAHHERVRDHADNHYANNATLGYDFYLIWRTLTMPYFMAKQRNPV